MDMDSAAWLRGGRGVARGLLIGMGMMAALGVGACGQRGAVGGAVGGGVAQGAGDGASSERATTQLMGVRELCSEQRDAAFDAARDVLRELRFELNRIDKREGVLTTSPKVSSGLATPWDIEQRSVRDELSDLLHKQARVVRVSLVAHEGSVRIEVVVSVLRTQTPGQRLSPRAVALSSVSADVTPLGPSELRGLGDSHVVARDDALAEWIVGEVLGRVMGGE
jgi:hypothetical protein